MFTRSDLDDLLADKTSLAVSIFLPTEIRGSQVRQNPIRLKNLVAQANDELARVGVNPTEAQTLLEPAVALIQDYQFWQHQDLGLALFLGAGDMRCHHVPVPLVEQVVVAQGFHIRPLLPILAADGAYKVLTLTAGVVRLYDASKFAMTEADSTGLPSDLTDELTDPDYENPVQASPVARPHTGTISIGNAQVYGESPAEWRKGRVVEFARRVAAALEQHLAGDPFPVVLIADAEIGGQFQKVSTLGPQLVGVIETNPEAMDIEQLHSTAYSVMHERLDAGRAQAIERFQALIGGGDARASATTHDVVRAAYQGRVDTAFVNNDATAWGHYDQDADQITVGETTQAGDLIEAAAVQTLQHGGTVHVLDEADMPGQAAAAAILRY